MAGASLRIPRFRSDEHWVTLQAIADELISTPASALLRSPDEGGRRALQQLSSRGFGYAGLFDLCALLVLAVHREPAFMGTAGTDAALPTAAEQGATAPPASSFATLSRGPVTVSAQPTEHHVEYLRDLEAAVADALLIRPERPGARSAVRRALMARGSTVRDATTVYGIVCQLICKRPSDDRALPGL